MINNFYLKFLADNHIFLSMCVSASFRKLLKSREIAIFMEIMYVKGWDLPLTFISLLLYTPDSGATTRVCCIQEV